MPSKALHEEIKDQLVRLQHADGQKLPSVRKMAAQLDVSVGSVVKAYAKLEETGLVKSYPGKGFYWGKLPISSEIKDIAETMTLEKKFQNDLETGFLNRFSALPTLKELALHYETSLYYLRFFLKEKMQQGILQKTGCVTTSTRKKRRVKITSSSLCIGATAGGIFTWTPNGSWKCSAFLRKLRRKKRFLCVMWATARLKISSSEKMARKSSLV